MGNPRAAYHAATGITGQLTDHAAVRYVRTVNGGARGALYLWGGAVSLSSVALLSWIVAGVQLNPLGILAAVAIPIFNGIQARAEENALKAATSTMASQAPANVAAGQAHGVPASAEGISYSVTGTTATTICVTGTKAGVTGSPYNSGPGCTP